MITDDEAILTDHTVWMLRVLQARRVPSDVVDDLYASVGQVLQRRTPRSAALVERARGASDVGDG